MPDHRHRSGALRQSNKKNKRSKASKRALGRKAGGRLANNTTAKNAATALASKSKADRRNMAVQKRTAKKQALMRQRRGLDSSSTTTTTTATAVVPKIVGILNLGPNLEMEENFRSFLLKSADQVVQLHDNASVSCSFDAFKKEGKVTFLTAQSAFAHYKKSSNDDNDADDDAAAVQAALDLVRICDVLLLVLDGNARRIDGNITEIQFGGGSVDERSTRTNATSQQDWDHLISDRGDKILTAIKGQGLPTPVTILAHTEKEEEDHMTMQSVKSLRRSKIKRQLDLKKYVSRFATTEFGTHNDKVLEVDLSSYLLQKEQQQNQEALMDDDDDDENENKEELDREIKLESSKVVRMLCTMSCSPAKWVAESPRSYIVSDTYQYNSHTFELSITGFIRGMAPFDVNSLMHVPGLGTYACKSIQKATAPLTRNHSRLQNTSMETSNNDSDIITADPEMRESLNMFATPDALDGEQNLIGFEEHDQDEFDGHEEEGGDTKFARPAGWSDYQSAWLDAVDEEEAVDHGELAEALNKKSKAGSEALTDTVMDLDDANDVNADERKALMEQRKKQQTEDAEFPDEVQVNEDDKAHERFARYRSLKSFRKSIWDPKENLPETYANIFHFSSFKQTQRSVMNEMKELIREAENAKGNFWGCTPKNPDDNAMMNDDASEDDDDDFLEGCVPSGSYVTVTLQDVPEKDVVQNLSPKALIAAVSLLQHENKVSVLHMGLSQSAKCDSSKEHPVKSKDVLTFRCGWRTWKARPVFSQNNLNCDKHKFERFLPTGGAFFAASIFGPVTYTPCPVLVFREKNNSPRNKLELLAIGSMIGSDADRIVVKRIVLTGYPVRVHKRYATVKYMFYNPDDVKWFKPAGLHTKHGLQGNIMQSVGEHGTMKCLFNAPIKQHDTVCLPLYKRIYPKYAPAEDKSSGSTVRDSESLIIR